MTTRSNLIFNSVTQWGPRAPYPATKLHRNGAAPNRGSLKQKNSETKGTWSSEMWNRKNPSNGKKIAVDNVHISTWSERWKMSDDDKALDIISNSETLQVGFFSATSKGGSPSWTQKPLVQVLQKFSFKDHRSSSPFKDSFHWLHCIGIPVSRATTSPHKTITMTKFPQWGGNIMPWVDAWLGKPSVFGYVT